MPSKLIHTDPLRRNAVHLVKGGKTKTGEIYYGAGVVLTLHIKTALARLVDLHKRAIGERSSSAHIRTLPAWAAKILHRRETLGVLGTLIGVGPDSRRSLTHSILHFSESQRSLEGIESVVFSAIIGAEREDPQLAAKARRVLNEIGAPRFMGGGYGESPVVDPIAKRLTFLGTEAVGKFTGGSTPASHGIGRPDPGGNLSDDSSTCVKVATVVSAVIGAAGGAALGGIAGGSIDNGKDKAVINIGIIGGGITGFFGGSQGGQSFGQAVCPNASPGTPAPSGTPSAGTAGPPGDLSQDQWEQNLISSTPDSTPDSGEQSNYGNGFDAGWAAATSGAGSSPPAGSDSFGTGFADGYGAAQAMQTLPTGGTGGGDTGGGTGGGDTGGGTSGGDTGGGTSGGDTGGGTSGGDTGGGTSGGDTGGGTSGGGGNASSEDPEGGVGDGPVTPGTGAIIHHFNPSGPGLGGLVSDDDSEGSDSPLKSFGTRVLTLGSVPDPENNPRARSELGRATVAQASLLSAAMAERLSGRVAIE